MAEDSAHNSRCKARATVQKQPHQHVWSSNVGRDSPVNPQKKKKEVGRDAAVEMPDFSIPEGEAEYKGDPANKRDQTSHRRHLAQLELQTQLKKVRH